MRDYIPIVIIVGLASVGMICILVDIVIGNAYNIKIRKKDHKIKNNDQSIPDSQADYEYDDYIIIND